MADESELEALKAKVAALEAAQKPVPMASLPPPRSGSGCLMPALLIGGCIIFLLVLVSGRNTDRGSTKTEPPSRPLATCDSQWAEQTFETARRTPLIRGVDMARGEGVIVMVRSRQWEFLNYSQQRSLAAAIDCAVAGNGNHLTALRFRTERNGPDLLALEAADLLRLREEGFGKRPE